MPKIPMHTFNASNVEAFRDVMATSSILGEAVLWSVRGANVTQEQVKAALNASGLPDKEARNFCYRNAFRRAIRKMKSGRIIRVVGESPTIVPTKKNPKGRDGILSFQFTAEFLAKLKTTRGEHDTAFRYDPEGIVILNKVTGEIESLNETLRDLAKKQLDTQMEERRSGDITAIIGRLYAKNTDVVHIIGGRGVFFVPAPYIDFTNKIDLFLSHVCQSQVTRLPIPSGTAHGNTSIRKSVEESINSLIDEYQDAINELSADASDRKRQSLSERIAQVRFRIDAYQDLLGNTKDRLYDAQQELDAALHAKIDELCNVPGDVHFDDAQADNTDTVDQSAAMAAV